MKTSARKIILITRPAGDADEFARAVEDMGFNPLIEPMLGILPVPFEKPDLSAFPGIVFTSANAVRIFGCPPAHTDVQVFAVGLHTAEEARRRGYTRVLSSTGDAGDLAALVKKKLTGHTYRLLHIRGEHTAMPLAEMLRKDRIAIETLIVYTAKSEDRFTPACHDALKRGTVGTVTFFSRRTAETFVRLAAQEGLTPHLSTIKALCISPAVLDCVRGAGWAEAYSAERPDKAAMLDLLKAAHNPD